MTDQYLTERMLGPTVAADLHQRLLNTTDWTALPDGISICRSSPLERWSFCIRTPHTACQTHWIHAQSRFPEPDLPALVWFILAYATCLSYHTGVCLTIGHRAYPHLFRKGATPPEPRQSPFLFFQS